MVTRRRARDISLDDGSWETKDEQATRSFPRALPETIRAARTEQSVDDNEVGFEFLTLFLLQLRG